MSYEIHEACNPLTAVYGFLQMMGEMKGGIFQNSSQSSVDRAFGSVCGVSAFRLTIALLPFPSTHVTSLRTACLTSSSG